jgi:hypothetical protein
MNNTVTRQAGAAPRQAGEHVGSALRMAAWPYIRPRKPSNPFANTIVTATK